MGRLECDSFALGTRSDAKLKLADGSITLNHQKEQFSLAYAIAVASVAGCSHGQPVPDEDSIDIAFSSARNGTVFNKPRLEAQLKATSRNLLQDDHIAYPLPVKNYDELRGDTHVPRILVVVVVPDQSDSWMRQEEFKTHLYRCAYWVSLFGMPAVGNTSTVTVHVPRKQIFNPKALSDMMDRIATGAKP